MRLAAITVIAMLAVAFCRVLHASEQSDNMNGGGCFVDSTGQVDSTVVRLVKILEGDYFHVRTKDGKLYLGRVRLHKSGVIITYAGDGGLSATNWIKETFGWDELILIQHRETSKGVDLSLFGAIGAAVLTCILLIK